MPAERRRYARVREIPQTKFERGRSGPRHCVAVMARSTVQPKPGSASAQRVAELAASDANRAASIALLFAQFVPRQASKEGGAGLGGGVEHRPNFPGSADEFSHFVDDQSERECHGAGAAGGRAPLRAPVERFHPL